MEARQFLLNKKENIHEILYLNAIAYAPLSPPFKKTLRAIRPVHPKCQRKRSTES